MKTVRFFHRAGAVAASRRALSAAAPRPALAARSSLRPAAAAPSAMGRAMRFFAAAGDDVVVPVPALGDSITEGRIESIEFAAGDAVDMDDVVLVIETDKIQVPIKAGKSGTIKEILVSEGDDVEVGADIFSITVGEGAPKSDDKSDDKSDAKSGSAPSPPSSPAGAPPPPPAGKAGSPPPPPSAASKADKPKKEDKKEAKKEAKKEDKGAAAAPKAMSREETRIRMTKMRSRIAQRLKESQNVNALLTTFQEVDMHALMAMRSAHKEAFEEKHGVKLGFMSAFAKASANALIDLPAVNAVIDEDDVVYRDYVDISVAVATPKGLVVPVVRNVESLSFAQVEKSIADFGAKARRNEISAEDMAGGTFTISNGGVFGSMLGTPIVNPPQSAILGLHNIVKRPVVIGPNDDIVVRPVMYLALTYDHRLVDGREAVTFLKRVKDDIEDPRRMLLDL